MKDDKERNEEKKRKDKVGRLPSEILPYFDGISISEAKQIMDNLISFLMSKPIDLHSKD